MAGDHDGCAGGGGGEVRAKPGELGGVDDGVEGALGGDLDGVEQDEVVAGLVKGAVRPGGEALFEGLLAVQGIGDGDVG